jgi:hypothetical protein
MISFFKVLPSALQGVFQEGTRHASASSENKTQNIVGRMDKLLWLIFLVAWIFFLSFFYPKTSLQRNTLFILLNIYNQ